MTSNSDTLNSDTLNSDIQDFNIQDDNDELSNINKLNICSYNRLRKMKRRLRWNDNNTRITSIVERLMNRPPPINCKSSRRIKINNDNYFYPDLNNYKMLLEYDFRLADLRSITREHKLKTTGSKEVLFCRIYNHFDITSNAIKIQSRIRRHHVKRYLDLQGPALKSRGRCVNHDDFCTMIPINNIPQTQFFSVECDGHIYGFDIMSIYNLFIQGNRAENPFTKTRFKSEVISQMLDFIRYSKMLNRGININFSNLVVDNEIDNLDLKAVTIFHKINMLGNYANSHWFTGLDHVGLSLFIKELMDIWDYRANLDPVVKFAICPPNGNPFKNIGPNNNIDQIHNLDYIRLKKLATIIIDNMVSSGIDEENKKLGAFYVLCGLTLVNIDAANALPWLYQSVMHD